VSAAVCLALLKCNDIQAADKPCHDSPRRNRYITQMKTKRLTEILERVESWPPEWQDQLAEIALDIDASLKDGIYQLSPEEIEAIDRARQSPLASDADVERAFAKFRGA
jgi:hypothetical protein